MNLCAAKRVWRGTSRRFRGECNGCENECQGVSPESSRQTYPSLGLRLRVSQAILEETPVLHIRDCNNQRHVLLQRHVCKRVRLEREASGLHNSWSILRKCIRNDLRRPEIQKFPRKACPQNSLVGALRAHLWAPRIAGNPLCESLPTPVSLNTQTVPPPSKFVHPPLRV